ncbi:MAG TPA: D-tyrosyl-tRNA(Tyr) deacylase [Methanocorpusculum sp.]|nr:D-tyrosyl-tRNA(Tyr) deacylase [Methanocorpusculum sp.]
MIIDILNSSIDPAGVNIRKAIDSLIATGETFPLFDGNEITFHTTDQRIINADNSCVNPDADLIIVVSRHSSVNPVPVLTVHPAGNFGAAQLGGRDFTQGKTAPAWMKSILQNEAEFVPEGYRVSYEITHHGPTDFPAPFFFVEVGSTEKEWNDEAAYTAAAKAVLFAHPASDTIPLIGFGGTHYAVRQTAIGLETRGAFGHIMHTRDVCNVTKEIVAQMAEKTGGVFGAHVDKKSLSRQDIARLEGVLSALEIPEITEGDLLKLNAMSYDSWVKFSEFAKTFNKDIKLFPHGTIADGEPAIIQIPDDLFSCAFAKYSDVLTDYLKSCGNVFHSTGASGKLLPYIFTTADFRAHVYGDLIALAVQNITRTQDSVVSDDTIIITRRVFDAKLARNLGVRSGPLFGQLSAGKSVMLEDGREITPDMVMQKTEVIIHIPGLE